MSEHQTAPTSTDEATGDGCPRCSTPIPLPLANFCTHCRYPLRTDSEERARAWLRRRR